MGHPHRRTVTIVNSKGLHARAAARFCKTAEKFNADITVGRGDVEVSACSIMGLMMLAAAQDSEVEISATGDEAREAIDALCQLIADKFGED